MEPELQIEEQRSNGHDKEREITTDLPRLIRVRWEQENTRVLMPEVISRIEAFCKRYDTDSNPDKLARSVWAHFAEDKKNKKGEPVESEIFIMVGYRRGVIGHVLATINEWFDRKFIMILQYEVDEESEINIGLLNMGLAIIGDWGRKQGAVEMEVLVKTPAIERAFRSFYGFEYHHTNMRKGL